MSDSADEPKSIELTGAAKGRSVSQAAAIKTRANFAGQHLLSAAKFARMSGDAETNNEGGSSADSSLFQDTTAYVTATLLTSTAALEAYINQLFIDGNVVPTHEIGGQSEELWNIWWSTIERWKIWSKYDLALALREQGSLFDEQSPLYPRYISAKLLVDVRNLLVHFKPQWSDEKREHHKITNRLVNEPVSPSPSGSTTPLFPHDFMSHDMARWAVKTSWNFIEAFSQRAGLDNKYAYMVNDLNPGYPTWPVR